MTSCMVHNVSVLFRFPSSLLSYGADVHTTTWPKEVNVLSDDV